LPNRLSPGDDEETAMERSTVGPLLGGVVAICFAVGAAARSATATLAPTAGNTAAGTVSCNPATPDHYAGDMPMLPADASGNATLTADLDVIRIGGGATDIVGKSVIVHKDADDFKTQPTGNSGARVACGVISKS
jgi:Cu/Zn superoxide dismutase